MARWVSPARKTAAITHVPPNRDQQGAALAQTTTAPRQPAKSQNGGQGSAPARCRPPNRDQQGAALGHATTVTRISDSRFTIRRRSEPYRPMPTAYPRRARYGALGVTRPKNRRHHPRPPEPRPTGSGTRACHHPPPFPRTIRDCQPAQTGVAGLRPRWRHAPPGRSLPTRPRTGGKPERRSAKSAALVLSSNRPPRPNPAPRGTPRLRSRSRMEKGVWEIWHEA